MNLSTDKILKTPDDLDCDIVMTFKMEPPPPFLKDIIRL